MIDLSFLHILTFQYDCYTQQNGASAWSQLLVLEFVFVLATINKKFIDIGNTICICICISISIGNFNQIVSFSARERLLGLDKERSSDFRVQGSDESRVSFPIFCLLIKNDADVIQ